MIRLSAGPGAPERIATRPMPSQFQILALAISFTVGGALQPTLTLAEGSTYKFDQSSGTNSTHPLRFSTTSDGTHGGGSEFTTGVTTSGTPGSAGGL